MNSAKPILAVAFATAHSPFEPTAARLARSLDDVRPELAHQVRLVPSQGSWAANTAHKAAFLKGMLQEFGATHRLLYLDSDAILRAYPRYLDTINCDVAACFLGGELLLSTTLYLVPGPATRRLIDDWLFLNLRYPRRWEQINLGLAMGRTAGIEIARLPSTYCWGLDAEHAASDSGAAVIDYSKGILSPTGEAAMAGRAWR